MEILIALGIVALAAFLLFRSGKKKTKGDCGCGCGSCSLQCPVNEDQREK
ncbi:FeoB-associated Cys-rich membrane protein [Lutispora thermophila]|uniref:Virus attachment protein p12 family protein n=1 Tax=Lutispora thermophila DSM 19022 TaxID=1122184 RepID=A0A1M6CB96_9FIRM|nr:FeoB-associated Cys-rich membrane protein [Lutispora thermophila]SHI58279.1 Virus attachment protein p12 family protein [Lutispora thermophila DSM 19022]